MNTMDELTDNIKIIIRYVFSLEFFTKVFFFIFKVIVLTVFVTLLTLFVLSYQLFLIISVLSTNVYAMFISISDLR